MKHQTKQTLKLLNLNFCLLNLINWGSKKKLQKAYKKLIVDGKRGTLKKQAVNHV